MSTNPFDPAYVAQLATPTVRERNQAAATKAARKKAEATGGGWGNGTIVLPGTPKRLAPGDMAKPEPKRPRISEREALAVAMFQAGATRRQACEAANVYPANLRRALKKVAG